MFDHFGRVLLYPRKSTQNTANVFYIIGKQRGMDSKWPLQRHHPSFLTTQECSIKFSTFRKSAE